MVERFKFKALGEWQLVKDPDGLWVRHSDYERLQAELRLLNEKLERVYEAGLNGINHVGAANYRSRQEEATQRLDDVYNQGQALKNGD